MKTTSESDRTRFPKWCPWALAFICASVAAFSCIAYMSNGMVVGDLMGLPGREHDVADAKHLARMWISLAALFQFGVVLAIFSLVKLESEVESFMRYTLRGLAAGLLSLPTTLLIGAVISAILKVFFRHPV